MLLVAFSRRMCCSRACRLSRYAGWPSASFETPDEPAGQLALEAAADGEEARVRAAHRHRHAEALARCRRRRRRPAPPAGSAASSRAGRRRRPRAPPRSFAAAMHRRSGPTTRPEAPGYCTSDAEQVALRQPVARRGPPRRARCRRASARPASTAFDCGSASASTTNARPLRALRRAPGEQHRLDDGGRLVEHRRVRGRQPREVGDHRLEVQQRLEAALRDLRLVRRVRRVPGGVLEHVPLDHRRRDRARVAEPDHRGADGVPRREARAARRSPARSVAAGGSAEGASAVQRGSPPARRGAISSSVDADADGVEHAGLRRRGSCRCAGGSKARRSGDGWRSDGERRSCGSRQRVVGGLVHQLGQLGEPHLEQPAGADRVAVHRPPGTAVTASFTSTTSPDTGQKSSPTDFVDSSSPTTWPASTASPTCGRSTKTMSPSWAAA